jgi:transcriptional regulator with XRE-family HTH domain
MYNFNKGNDEMVAQKLKELRKEHKLTQSEVADILNISRAAYSMYENARRQLNYEALCTIANYYKVSLDYLFDRTDMRELSMVLSRAESSLLLEYRALDARGQENILDMTRLEYERVRKEKNFIMSAI